MPVRGNKSKAKSNNAIQCGVVECFGGDNEIQSCAIQNVVDNAKAVSSDESREGHACKTCRGPDTEEMVQCDACDGWHHFACVGVSEEIANQSWSCTSCVTAKWVQRTKAASDGAPVHESVIDDRRSLRNLSIGKIVTSNRGNPVIPPVLLSTNQLTVSSSNQQPVPPDTVPAQMAPQYQLRGVSKPGVCINETSSKPTQSLKAPPIQERRTDPAPAYCQQNQRPSLPAVSLQVIDVEKALSEISISSSRKSAKDRAKLQLMRLQEERAFQLQQEEKAAQEYKLYLDNKYKILENLANDKASSRSSNVCGSRVEEWVRGTAPIAIDTAEASAPERSRKHDDVFQQQREELEKQASTINRMREEQLEQGRLLREQQQQLSNWHAEVRSQPRNRISSHQEPGRFVPHALPQSTQLHPREPGVLRSTHENPTNDHNTFSVKSSSVDEYDQFQLSRSQIAARQAVSKDLPIFSGNPEEWPVFMSMYNRTTTMCGFTDDENIVRLQKSLKGKAYDAVKSRLMHSGNVSGILTTLKMLFGQPEVIIQSLIDKISSLPPIREDRLETLINFAVSVQNFCATVDACGMQEYIYNVTMLHQLVGKLPSSLKLTWAQHRLTLKNVNLASFGQWIYTLAEAASVVVFPPTVRGMQSTHNEARGSRKGNAYLGAHSETFHPQENYESDTEEPSTVAATSFREACPVCKGSCKSADKCQRFLELSRESKWAVIREFGYCRTCLRIHRGVCKAKPCGKNGCTYRHHALLHNDSRQKIAGIPERTQSPLPGTSRSDCNTHQATGSSALFRYLPVTLYGTKKAIRTFAFLDEGSALTLLDQDLANELCLEGSTRPLCLRWTGGTERHEANSRVCNLQIAGIDKESKQFQLDEVRTVEELLLPQQTLDISELSQLYPHLRNLPIESYSNARPRILIGMKHAQLILMLKCREGRMGQPIAIKTRLGWTVCGGWSTANDASLHHYTFHVCQCSDGFDENLHQAMKDYFALDSLGVTKSEKLSLSTEDKRAMLLLESLTRLKEDRYECGLLWRYDDTRLPDSRSMALRRFVCLKKRLEKDSDLAKTLQDKIIDYEAKGYIRKLTEEEIMQRVPRRWYLPVFPVTNPNKPGKVRIVWDAAASAHGTSLNSALITGPDLLGSLFAILLNFRRRSVGLTGDIREMFHQIMIRLEDQPSQCFYWQDSHEDTVVYVMRVMTFGACCSPTTAQFVKNTNAERFAYHYPAAYEAITKSHYVDDMLVSVDTEEQAIQLAKDVKHVHAEGGFEIRNWISNSSKVLASLKGSEADEKCLDLSSELATEKVLGMWWNTRDDVFTYKIGWHRYDTALLAGQRRPTKREVLRVLMSIFDPLGLISHVLSYLKILLQQIWRSGVQWDEPINEDSFHKWLTWLKVLPLVEQLRIPRCYNKLYSMDDADEIQLHTMVDASENAMAAVCYLRFLKDDIFNCSIVAAKTRVAPLKFVSIPRMELEAARLGARLSLTVAESLCIRGFKKFYWTDSKNVLSWINSDHRRYNQYVGHRVSEILEISERCEWRWVPGKLNPADDATKWTSLPDLSSDHRWFKGAEFLQSLEENWPKSSCCNEATENELRSCFLACHTHPISVLSFIDFSSWKRLIRVVAQVHRFADNCRRRRAGKCATTGTLTTDELLNAEQSLIRLAQREMYPNEIAALQGSNRDAGTSAKVIPKSSSLYQLTPWLDERGIMRMRTRIAACHYATEDAKQPILLHKKHHITSLIVNHYHQKYHHQNHETVINEIRQKFRIPQLRACYNQVRRSCQRCKNYSTIPRPPYMADLPPARLAAFSRPFTHVGVDYFGPIEVAVGRRVEKRWGMLATCLTVRAIHIEVVYSLSTSSCIIAIQNFIARRGAPQKIYSDRGTNFVGANRELRRISETINQHELMKEFADSGIEWVFNPPLSPHMGGSWERLIRTVKSNLMVVCRSKRPSDEVLHNLLVQVENIVNSRPLTHVPIDEDSAPALTPNDFLLGSSNGSKPLTTLDDSGATLKMNWCTSQILANQYWKRRCSGDCGQQNAPQLLAQGENH
ncbi:uncharacterized protein LOC128735804 [Sabethes cyaneus]|uniref:uncharacterized protein LOC128735804 n=1 Tax=Sabethes cyaneus TaxID=53552 RepID=UPI00237DB81F|nr:uncharacterized protein LOC128735804 [Sabethes cyaneus]